MHNINSTTDELSYLLELLNNERYTSNTNAVIADTLSAVLHDASWHGDTNILQHLGQGLRRARLDDVHAQTVELLGESDPTDEEIDAQIAYASRTRE